MLRPRPPAWLVGIESLVFGSGRTEPAPEVADWLQATFLEPDGPLYNPDHEHLRFALIGVLWTNAPNARQMRRVVGQAEMPQFKGGAWGKARQEQQMTEWFGLLPHFVLTFDALHAAEAGDAEWCALVEHELYHCAQAKDAFGAPKFRKDGSPAFALRGHDVEEFVGVVRRYGAGGAAALVEAANAEPEIAPAGIAQACGVCIG